MYGLYYSQDTWAALEWNKILAGIVGLGRDCVSMSLENHFFSVFEFFNQKKKNQQLWQREE